MVTRNLKYYTLDVIYTKYLVPYSIDHFIDHMYIYIYCLCGPSVPFSSSAATQADALHSGKYDSVLADREASVGTYREFVIFDEEPCVVVKRVFKICHLLRSFILIYQKTTSRNCQT